MRFTRAVVQTLAVLVWSASPSPSLFLGSSQGIGVALAQEDSASEVPVDLSATEDDPTDTTNQDAATATAAAAEESKEDAPYVPPQDAVKYSFEAEVHRMLDIVVNSLYQNNDVFLRELISNASDALDKIRYLLLTEPDKYKDGADVPLDVQIEYDATAHTLTIRDTGVGMTRDDLVQNLGTVARSGTTKFMQALKEKGNDNAMSQIGQFGVGFYSTFLVADRVSVASKSPLDPVQQVWESNNGSSEFIVYEDPRGNTLIRGTEITLHLKPDVRDTYTQPYKLRQMATHYSEFVTHPISLRTTETTQEEVDDDDDSELTNNDKKEEEEDDLEVSDDEESDAVKPKKTKEVTTHNWERLNENQAIWTREKEDITDDEYQAFFQVLSPGTGNATTWTHFNAEGSINFKALLYLPGDIPSNYKYGNMDVEVGAMRLYVRRVLIGDSFDLLPRYLGFLKGVVDSDDLPLNVNRETLQESKILKIIQKKVVRKAIELIQRLARDSEPKKDTESDEKEAEGGDEDDADEPKENAYLEFYKKFSANIKLGVLDDNANQAKLIKLLRFETSKSNGTMISIAAYKENMKDWQKDIYVLGCINADECASSPFLQAFREKDAEVVFLTDAVDEYMVKNVRDFDGKKMVQISSENVKLNDEDEDLIKRREKVYQKKFKGLTKWLRQLYHGTVLRVQVAKRSLGSAPAIVSSSDYGNSANMERIMKAQAFQHGVDPSQMMAMKVFEINPRHPLILQLLEGCPPEDDKEGKDAFKVAPELIDAAWMLHDMAMMGGGFPIHDADAHNKRLVKVLQNQFGLATLDLEAEIHPPIEEDEFSEPDTGAGGMNMEDFNMDDFNMDNIDMDNLNLDALKEEMEGSGIQSDEL